jgi:hypothetical protein
VSSCQHGAAVYGHPTYRAESLENIAVATIVLRPRFFEIGIFGKQYDELTEALEAAGHDVRVEREVEGRGAAEIARTLYDVAVHLADEADEALVDSIVLALVTWLRGKAVLGANRGKRRRAFVYGSRGEVLSEVELPDDDPSQ